MGKGTSAKLAVEMATATASLGGSSVLKASVNPPDLSPKVLRVPQAISCMLHAFPSFAERLALSWVLGT